MTQSYRLIKKTLLATASVILLMGEAYASSIGGVIESTGVVSLVRESSDEVKADVGQEIELNDTAQTAKGRMLIKFLDDAELSLIEHTKVYIDKVYYDPNPSKSKMVMKMALGTARFASGRLGMVDKQNIDISTPTATIAVRGTDFTTTVDELGRSLVILLPDEWGEPSGEIIVSNDAGSITLTEAYAATLVSSIATPPTAKVVIDNITPATIDNMFIVNPPEEVKQALEEQLADEQDKDMGALDVDYLAFDELEKDFSDYVDDGVYTRLDFDALSGDFLTDVQDVVEELIRTMAELEDVQDNTGSSRARLVNAKWGYNTDSQYSVFEEDGGIVFYRNVEGVISIRFLTGGGITLFTDVNGYKDTITADGGEEINVFVTQQDF